MIDGSQGSKYVFDGDSQKTFYLLKFNKRNTGERWEIYSKLTIMTPERRH